MEVPGRDVTADALGPEDPTPGAEPAAREETREPSDSSGDA
ncbi:MAG: hypothetical protein QOH46_3230, partial [Solirubrobacteraceae bacterium]|nr:hypothetical protein [Solirubrobacteraceae bacterium]